ncbi:hypothetical protein GN956_G5005 [Arapaima gigas]
MRCMIMGLAVLRPTPSPCGGHPAPQNTHHHGPQHPPPPVLPRPISMEEHTHHDLQKKPLSPNPQEECVKTRNSHDVG